MMSLADKYEEFGNQIAFLDETVRQDGRDIDNEKLQSFEDGYEAGWDDSIEAQKLSRKKISSMLAENLQEISFSYHEARSTLMQGLRPLFEDVMNVFLPEVVKSTMGPHIIAQLGELAQERSDQCIEIAVSSEDYDSLNELLRTLISDPFILIADTSLESGQVYLKVGTKEREINFVKLIKEVRNSTNNLFEQEPVDGSTH